MVRNTRSDRCFFRFVTERSQKEAANTPGGMEVKQELAKNLASLQKLEQKLNAVKTTVPACSGASVVAPVFCRRFSSVSVVFYVICFQSVSLVFMRNVSLV